jgi:hypothetical protein
MTVDEVVNSLTKRNVLKREEILALLQSVFADEKGKVPEYAEKLYTWAEHTRKQTLLLDMILKGALSVTYNPAGEMVVGLTELASELKKALEAE